MWNLSDSRTRIKLCEFESLDASYEAACMGADALGFHFFQKHDRHERMDRFGEIFRYLPDGVSKTLLTDIDLDLLVCACERLGVDTIQLYPDWKPAKIQKLRKRLNPALKILKVMSALSSENEPEDDRSFLELYSPVVDGILLDSRRVGGTGLIADWDHSASIVRSCCRPVFLAGGLSSDNVREAIARVRPFGVDVENGISDRVPSGPLVKNMFKCHRFIEAVRSADQEIERGLQRCASTN